VKFLNQPIDWKKVMAFAVTCLVSCAFACYCQPQYHDNPNSILVVATVFSVLAGFLITVMTLIADDRSIRGRNSRQSVTHLELVKKDLRRHRNMFYLYLLVLALAFVGSLNLNKLSWIEWQNWCERLVLFFSSIAMLWSFQLPGYLTRRHIEALDRGIREQREREQH